MSQNYRQLLDMGVPSERAEVLLRETGGNLENAINLYFSEGSNQQSYASAAANNNGAQVGQILQNSEQVPADLKQAIERSMQDQGQGQNSEPVDDELQKVLELSKHTANQPQAPTMMETDSDGNIITSQAETELNKAIAASLQDTNVDTMSFIATSTNPIDRRRDDFSIPAGLKNVGNTCYLNSMLQTYFQIPIIRDKILSLPFELENDEKNQDTLAFMKELQRLYAYLLLTKQKFVDPSSLWKKMTDSEGNPINIGNQEDVGEFNELFLQKIEKGIELIDENQKNEESKFIKDLFYGQQVEYITATEEDGTQYETSSEEVVGNLILTCNDDIHDLFMSVDNYTVNELDEFTTPKGFKTNGLSSKWFKKIPQTLLFQQNRVGFSKATGEYQKINSPLKFEKEISMARYLVENRDKTSAIRLQETDLRKKLHTLKEEYKKYTDFQGRSQPLDLVLQSTIDYIISQPDSGIDPQLVQMEQIFRGYLDKEKNVMQDLSGQILELEEQISKLYDEINDTENYSLFAVWIHQGVAGTGHYWAYLRDPKSDKWTGFNDLRVTDAHDETVMLESFGGHNNTSASFLIYIKKELCDSMDFKADPDTLVDLMAESLKQDVEESNKNFEEACQKHEEKEGEGKIEKFTKDFNENKEDFEKNAKEWTIQKDLRISNFWVFLCSIGLSDLMLAGLLRNTYVTTFEKGIHLDLDSPHYPKIVEKIGKEQVERATALAFNDEEEKQYKDQHAIFRDVSYLYQQGLYHLLNDDFIRGFHHFSFALKKDREITLDKSLNKENEILLAARTAIKHLVSSIVYNQVKSEQFHQILSQNIGAVLMILDADDPIILDIQELVQDLVQLENITPHQRNGLVTVLGLFSVDVATQLKKVNQAGPTIPKYEKAQYEDMVERMDEIYTKFNQNFHLSIVNVKEILQGESVAMDD